MRRYVALREAGGGGPLFRAAVPRPKLIDSFLPKVEELVENSKARIRADKVHERLVAMGFQGTERTTRRECLNRNHWNTLLEARVVIGDFKQEHNQRHRHSALGYRTPAEYAANCRCAHTPVACEIG